MDATLVRTTANNLLPESNHAGGSDNDGALASHGFKADNPERFVCRWQHDEISCQEVSDAFRVLDPFGDEAHGGLNVEIGHHLMGGVIQITCAKNDQMRVRVMGRYVRPGGQQIDDSLHPGQSSDKKYY